MNRSANSKQIPDDFMSRLPTATAYYNARVRLTEADEHGWSDAVCPLHRYPMGHRIRIDLLTGRFACPTCGRGDMILFDMLHTGRGFKQTVLALIAEAEGHG